MKIRVGELYGKQIVETANPVEISHNEILCENADRGIVLKYRNAEGALQELTAAPVVKVPSVKANKVKIALNSTIQGPDKWAEGSCYLFYIDKNDKFKITDTSTKEDITSKASLVATGKLYKVYELGYKDYAPITIEEAL